jgi:hypothetical protein
LRSLEHLLELIARRESVDNATVQDVLLVLAEDVTSASDKNTLLGVTLRTIPPLSDDVRQENSQKSTINQKYVFSIAVHDDKLRKSDANAEALLAIGMTILEIVVADFFVSKCFISLGELYEALIEHLHSLILGGIGADFIGVVDKGEALVVARNGSFIGAL